MKINTPQQHLGILFWHLVSWGYVKHTCPCVGHMHLSPLQRILGGGAQSPRVVFLQTALDNHLTCTDCIFFLCKVRI